MQFFHNMFSESRSEPRFPTSKQGVKTLETNRSQDSGLESNSQKPIPLDLCQSDHSLLVEVSIDNLCLVLSDFFDWNLTAKKRTWGFKTFENRDIRLNGLNISKKTILSKVTIFVFDIDYSDPTDIRVDKIFVDLHPMHDSDHRNFKGSSKYYTWHRFYDHEPLQKHIESDKTVFSGQLIPDGHFKIELATASHS